VAANPACRSNRQCPRREPARECEQSAVLSRVARQRAQGSCERQAISATRSSRVRRAGGDAPSSMSRYSPSFAAAILDDQLAFRNHFGRARHRGAVDRGLEMRPRMALVGEQIDRVGVDRGIGDLVFEPARHPVGVVGHGSATGRETSAFRCAHPGAQQCRATVKGRTAGAWSVRTAPAVQSALHQDRIGLRVGAQFVKARLAVEVASGVSTVPLAGYRRSLSVIEPLRMAARCWRCARAGRPSATLRTCRIESSLPSLESPYAHGSRRPRAATVERHMAGRAAESGGVDEHTATPCSCTNSLKLSAPAGRC